MRAQNNIHTQYTCFLSFFFVAGLKEHSIANYFRHLANTVHDRESFTILQTAWDTMLVRSGVVVFVLLLVLMFSLLMFVLTCLSLSSPFVFVLYSSVLIILFTLSFF